MTLAPGFNPLTWFVTVAAGAPVGNYSFDVTLRGGNVLEPLVVAVEAPATHGEQPGDFTITVTPIGELGSDAAFALAAEGDTSGVIFQCKLEQDGEHWVEHGDEPLHRRRSGRPASRPRSTRAWPRAEYEFFARGRRGEVFSPVVTVAWTVTDGTGPGNDPGGEPGDDPGGGARW